MSRTATKEQSAAEKVFRIGRDFNAIIAIGGTLVAVALPGAQPLLVAYNIWNGAQAVGFEAARRWQAGKTTKKIGATALAH